MKPRRIFKITLTDESRLQTIGSVSLTPAKAIASAAAFLLLILFLGFLFVLLTPVKEFIPGYFRESQRAASEQALMRVDSIREAFQRNETYMANLRTVLDIGRPAASIDNDHAENRPVSADSLLPPSAEETSFVHMMQDREKFNISVVAPMAAEGMLFYPATHDGIITHASRSPHTARVILPAGSSVMAIADGVVVARYHDPSQHGHTILLQHDNGFVSRYAGLGSPLVGQLEIVLGGEVLSLPPEGRAGHPTEITVELWHNGVPLIPFDYISSHHSYTSLPY